MKPLKVVIDSNVLLRTLISGGNILELIFNNNLQLFAPKKLFEEFEKHKEEILLKSKFSEERFNLLFLLIFKRIRFIPYNEYKLFISESEQLLKGHAKDRHFVALALSKNIKLWTYEDLLFKIGIAISTKQISDKLKELA
jgi:predicted nucleic acid-binding protein